MNRRLICTALAALMLTGCGAPAEEPAKSPATSTTATAASTTAAETTAETTASAETTGTTVTSTAAAQKAGATTAASSSAAVTVAGVATTASAAAVSKVTTAKTTAGSSAAISESDKKAITDVVSKFMDGLISRDAEKILDATNLRDVREIEKLKSEDPPMTDKELIKEFLGDLDSDVKVVSYEITEIKQEPDDTYSKLEQQLAEAKQTAEKDNDEEMAENIRILESYLTGVEKYVSAVVKITLPDTDEDDDNSGPFPVICKNGNWTVDCYLGYIASSLGFMLRSKQIMANAAAKSIYNALQTSLVDMDTEGIDVTVLYNKQFTWKGSDFENLSKNPNKSDMLKYLKYKIALYYSDITKAEEIRIAFEDDSYAAVAVKIKGKIGVYPMQQDKDPYTDISKALSETLKYVQSNR